MIISGGIILIMHCPHRLHHQHHRKLMVPSLGLLHKHGTFNFSLATTKRVSVTKYFASETSQIPANPKHEPPHCYDMIPTILFTMSEIATTIVYFLLFVAFLVLFVWLYTSGYRFV